MTTPKLDHKWTLACIYMDLRNLSCLISTSGHHLERDWSRQKPEPLDNWICWLSSANQNAHHKHWIVFSACKVGGILHCALHHAVSNDVLYMYDVQCIMDCLPVSASAEQVYSTLRRCNHWDIWLSLHRSDWRSHTSIYCRIVIYTNLVQLTALKTTLQTFQSF